MYHYHAVRQALAIEDHHPRPAPVHRAELSEVYAAEQAARERARLRLSPVVGGQGRGDVLACDLIAPATATTAENPFRKATCPECGERPRWGKLATCRECAPAIDGVESVSIEDLHRRGNAALVAGIAAMPEPLPGTLAGVMAERDEASANKRWFMGEAKKLTPRGKDFTGFSIREVDPTVGTDAPVLRSRPKCPKCSDDMSRFAAQEAEPDTNTKPHAAGWECACGHAVYDDFGHGGVA